MMMLDTHVLVWAVLATEDLGEKAKSLMRKHEKEQTLMVSAFSFWEIELLVQKGRLQLPMTTQVLRRECLAQGIKEVGVSGDIGIVSCQLDLHGDPADRIIVASSLQVGASLLTADKKILSWNNPALPLMRLDAKK